MKTTYLLSAFVLAVWVSPVLAQDSSKRVVGGATISARLVSELFSRPVEQTTAIHENMMGAETRGTAWTEGNVLAEFLPNASAATLNIRLKGSMLAYNRSQRGQITVKSGFRTSIDAEKQIFLQRSGPESGDAVARCATSMWIRDISARGPIIKRLAERRVKRQQGQIESTTSSRTAQEIESQLDREVSTLISQMKDGSKGTLADDVPLDVRFQTSGDRLFVSLLTDQIARRPGKNGGMAAGEFDLGLSAHQALIEIALGHLVRNKAITDTKVLNLIQTITGDSPRQLWVHERRPRWSLTMANVERPIEVAFDDQGVHVSLVARKLTVGEDEFKTPLRISVQYKTQPTSDGPRLMRQGPVKVTTDKPNAKATQFLTRKFSAFFQEDLYFDGLVPPVGGSGGKLRRLQITRFSTQDGWLILGYSLPQPAVVAN